MRRLAGTGLLELSWSAQTVATRRMKQSSGVLWDSAAGAYRQVRPKNVPVERLIDRRAVRLTALGALLMDRVRPDLEADRPIRWASIMEIDSA
jgi:hypothetical protein